MLKNILSGSDCANCKICCIFDKYDLWETPVLDDELKAKTAERFPDASFVRKGDGWIFRMSEAEDGLYYCPMLDSKTGCKLGDEKPFDCRIWPYRIMSLGGSRVISIASICPTMYKKPLEELCAELERDGLGEKIFAFADAHPYIVKPYEDGYPILKVEKSRVPKAKNADMQRLESQLAFLMEADKLKNIYRQTYTRTDDLPPMPENSNVTKPYPRRENDAEHSFSLALFTAVLAEYSNEPIDVPKTMKMVLVHDIVEIDAGDTYCYDAAGNFTKAERENAAAKRLFELLPAEQVEEYIGLWREFEERETPEARFAHVMDRIQPLLLNLSRDGLSWQEHGIHFGQVEKRMSVMADGSESLHSYMLKLLCAARDKGILPE